MISGNQKIVKKNEFRLAKKPYLVGKKDGQETEEPEISVKKEKDIITEIEVKCVCGRIINIETR